MTDRVLIDAMIAGVQKAGTSSLAHYLGQHPNVAIHNSREFNYFVLEKKYKKNFKKVASKYYNLEQVKKSKIILAKSVGVCYYENATERLKKHNKECKIIISLRDPVKRAYSAFLFNRKQGIERRKKFKKVVYECLQDRESNEKKYREYISRGEYVEQIKKMKSQFGRDRILVVTLKDLKMRPIDVCKESYNLMGVDDDFTPSTTEKKNTSKKARYEWLARATNHAFNESNMLKSIAKYVVPSGLARNVRRTLQSWNEKDFTPPPMSEDVRRTLAEHYEPYNRELEDMLNRSLDHWTRASPNDNE